MIELTYKAIKPYIQEEEQRGDVMHCLFLIEEEEFRASAKIEEGDGAVSQIAQKTGVMRSMMLRVLKKAVRNPNTDAKTGMTTTIFAKKDKEAAVVRAFEDILDEIIYLETTGKWHLATEFSEFERRIRQNPMTEHYDKKIMSRMLVEMARADGRIEEKERLFFEHFLNDETGRLSDLMRAAYLKAQNCEKVSQAARPTIFMIVAAVALTDNEFNKEEQTKLDEFAQMFGFDATTKKELLLIAQDYTIEVAIKAKKQKLSQEELYALADKIGMDRSAATKSQDNFSF